MLHCAQRAGCQSEGLASLGAAERRLRSTGFDLVIWGVTAGAPRGEGVGALRRAASAHLILIDESFEDARESFDAGADQVLPKPFVPGALVGAIRAGLRPPAADPGSGSGPGPGSDTAAGSRAQIEGAVLDPDRRSIRVRDATVTLTRREWELVTYLLAHPGRYFSAAELVRQAWGSHARAPEQLRSYVARIRRKLGEVNLPVRILSQQGRGYCLAVEAGPEQPPGRPERMTPPRG